MEIKVSEYVTLNQGVTLEEGEKIYNMIDVALKGNDQVKLDFTGITLTTTAFLNVVIGVLYKDYSPEELRRRLILEGVSAETREKIKKVTNTAKLFYQNQTTFNKNVEEVLYGN